MSTNPITIDAQAAAQQLLDTLKTAGATAGQTLETFATEYAPEFARIGALLATAKVVNDTASITRYQTDIDALTAAAAEAAAMAGINVEASEEQTTLNVLSGFVNVLVSAAIKAI